MCSVLSGSYAVHMYRYALSVDSLLVTRIDAIAPILIALGILSVTLSIQKCFNQRQAGLLFLAILLLLDACILSGLQRLFTHEAGGNTVKIVIFILHQVIFFGVAGALDGSLLPHLLPSAAVTGATGIVSAFAYIGGTISPALFYQKAASLNGWIELITILSYLQCASAILLTLMWVSSRLQNKE